MIYELWHLDGGSIIGAWDHEDEALAVVLASIQAHGLGSVESWMLLAGEADGELTTIAEGAALVERAQTAMTAV
jgi:hypothetical protein